MVQQPAGYGTLGSCMHMGSSKYFLAGRSQLRRVGCNCPHQKYFFVYFFLLIFSKIFNFHYKCPRSNSKIFFVYIIFALLNWILGSVPEFLETANDVNTCLDASWSTHVSRPWWKTTITPNYYTNHDGRFESTLTLTSFTCIGLGLTILNSTCLLRRCFDSV